MGQKKLEPLPQKAGRPRAERPPLSTLAGSLANRLESLRDARGLSQPDLAKLAGVGKGTIQRIERGDTSPSLDTIVAVAKAFGMSAREFMSPCSEW